MTLDQFRRLDTVKLTGALSKPACNESSDVGNSSTDLPGVVVCRFIQEDGGSPEQSKLIVAGGIATSYAFRFFTLPGHSEPQLYRIDLGTENPETLSVIDGLVARFGVATSQQVSQRHTPTGRTVDDSTFNWENAQSLITVLMFGDLPGGAVSYELKDYMNTISNLKAKARQQAAAGGV